MSGLTCMHVFVGQDGAPNRACGEPARRYTWHGLEVDYCPEHAAPLLVAMARTPAQRAADLVRPIGTEPQG